MSLSFHVRAVGVRCVYYPHSSYYGVVCFSAIHTLTAVSVSVIIAVGFR